MIVLPCNQTTYFDVDDTLVMWEKPTPDDPRAIAITCLGLTEYLIPHRKHIEQLKAHKFRGHTVIVWSAGGWQWAEAVVKSLGLEDSVDLVIEKPTWYYDDITCQEFMGKRYYFKDEPDAVAKESK